VYIMNGNKFILTSFIYSDFVICRNNIKINICYSVNDLIIHSFSYPFILWWGSRVQQPYEDAKYPTVTMLS